MMFASWDSPPRQANGVIHKAAYRCLWTLEEADQDLCLPLPLTHVALFNSSRSSLAGPARIEPATPSLRERQSTRPNHAGELRRQATGAVVDRQGDRQMVSGPGRGGRPRAAHACDQPAEETANHRLHLLQQT